MQPALGLICCLRCQYLTRFIAAAARSSDYGALFRLDDFSANEIELWRGDLAHLPRRQLHRHLRQPPLPRYLPRERRELARLRRTRLRAHPLGRCHPAAAPSPRA